MKINFSNQKIEETKKENNQINKIDIPFLTV